MSLNDTPGAERFRIGFFGCRNAGKSSLFNAFAGQSLAVVSSTPGTTTDPVTKSMELLPAGPVVLVDTPGLDDEGELGSKRVEQSEKELRRCDLVLLVCDAAEGMKDDDARILGRARSAGVPCLVVMSKCDLLVDAPCDNALADGTPEKPWHVSARDGTGVQELREAAGKLLAGGFAERPIVSDLLPSGATVVLVVPIDKAAPKGRLILPQQMVIRELLDHGCTAVAVRDGELAAALRWCRPDMVITDSQVFAPVSRVVPEAVPLTSFSILFARYKGSLEMLVAGVRAVESLSDGDRVLVSEGCTHRRQCGDIGTVKLPALVRSYTGKDVAFDASSGLDFPADLGRYRMVFHCGGCMIPAREMRHRMRSAAASGVPMTNYGIAIAHMGGILERAVAPLGLGLQEHDPEHRAQSDNGGGVEPGF